MSDNKNREEEDLDQSFLDDVLNKLYDFGDGPASKRKRKSQKKKKRKKGDEEDAEEDCCDTVDCLDEGRPQDSSGTNRLNSLETESTAPANQEQLPKVEVVTFQDPMKMLRVTKKKPASALVVPVKPPMKEAQQPGSEQLGKARLEVYRFGLTGYKKEQQRVFEQERAIMLGAKPPKRECVNYKVYQQTIKEKKEKAKEEAQTDKKKKKRKQRDEKQKSSSGGSAPTGQLGRFKNGMLVLNAQEVRRAGIKPRVSKSSQ